jgi:hypothetical protein
MIGIMPKIAYQLLAMYRLLLTDSFTLLPKAYAINAITTMSKRLVTIFSIPVGEDDAVIVSKVRSMRARITANISYFFTSLERNVGKVISLAVTSQWKITRFPPVVGSENL